MNEAIAIVYTSPAYALSLWQAIKTVAEERKYLASTRGFPRDATREFVDKVVEKRMAQYLAVEGDTVVGWCDILPKPWEGMAHVGTLGMGVVAEYRGQGLGSRLLQVTEDHARDRNLLEKIELEVFESNRPAIWLYEKYGYQFEGKRLRGRKLDGEYDNIVLMGKMLQSAAHNQA